MDPVLAQLSDTLATAATLEDLTRPMLEMLEAITGCESTYLTSIDLEGGMQRIVVARNAKADGLQIPEGLTVPWADTLCKRALDEGRPYTSNVAECWGDSEAARALGIRTYVSTPVRTDAGQLYGTLCAASMEEVPLRIDTQHVLQLFSRLIGQHVERERLVAKLRLANALLVARTRTDMLTELPNRRSLMEELQAMIARGARTGESVLVAFIDLDGFKAINDLHGHECGDGFLRAMAERLSAELREGDLLARLGGDEFVLIGPGPALGDGTAETAARAALTDAMARRLGDATVGDIAVGNTVIRYMGASVGVVAIDPQVCSADHALRQADAAMYKAKRLRAKARR